MRKYTKFKQQRWEQKDEQNLFSEWHFYDNCLFRACNFSNCRWIHSKFYQVSFVGNCRFNGCLFEDCRFWGQYSCMGLATFEDCEFRNCQIKDVEFGEAKFIRCSFPESQLENIGFNGSPPNNAVVLSNIDFRAATMTFTAFRLGVDLTSVQLPAKGIRAFRNPNNELGRKLAAASGVGEDIVDFDSQLKQCSHRAFLVLGTNDPVNPKETPEWMHFKIQDPLVFDTLFLDEILTIPDERSIFETLVESYEIH